MKATLLTILSLALALQAYAGSATWNFNPSSSDWNTAGNWTPASIPDGPGDVATFGQSNQAAPSLSAPTEVNSIIFQPGASAFTITTTPGFALTLSGDGVINNSGIAEHLKCDDDESGQRVGITFTNDATAGSDVTYTLFGGQGTFGYGGQVIFHDSSSADHAVFDVFGSFGAVTTGKLWFYEQSTGGNAAINLYPSGALEVDGFFNGIVSAATLGDAIVNNNGGVITITSSGTAGEAYITNSGIATGFYYSMVVTSNVIGGSGSAGDATIVNQAAVGSTKHGVTIFQGTGSAQDAVIINNGGDGVANPGGSLLMSFGAGGAPTAGNATLICNPGTNGGGGGLIAFYSRSLGGTARCELFGNGNLDLSSREAPGITIGSLEGDGLVFLGANNLTVGSNNLSTVFTGVVQDGGIAGGTQGSLTKTGSGVLTLGSASTFTGTTTVSQGTLLVTNTSGSATAAGRVNINAGALGGSGIIAGAVTAGTGSGAGASLAPAFGSKKQVTLTLQSSLTLQSDATYTYGFKARSNQSRSDLVVANGVTITGAKIKLRGKISGTLTPGLVLTVLSNTSANPISGTFSNLANGAIVTINGSNLQASYTGGDGNDLTLTVIP